MEKLIFCFEKKACCLELLKNQRAYKNLEKNVFSIFKTKEKTGFSDKLKRKMRNKYYIDQPEKLKNPITQKFLLLVPEEKFFQEKKFLPLQ